MDTAVSVSHRAQQRWEDVVFETCARAIARNAFLRSGEVEQGAELPAHGGLLHGNVASVLVVVEHRQTAARNRGSSRANAASCRAASANIRRFSPIR